MIYSSSSSEIVLDSATYNANNSLVQSFKEISVGAGSDIFKVNKEGLFLGATNFTDAPFKSTFAGDVTASSITITGGNISGIKLGDITTGSMPSIQGWTSTLTLSATDNDTVAWSSGTIKLTDGTSYSINAGNTGNMTQVTYIYLDVGTSVTVLQTTTTATNAVGANKILVAVANNVEAGKDAEFQAFGGKGGVNTLVTADNIASNTITANEIATNTITANEMNVSKLSAISANLGTITAGTVTGATIQTATTGERCKMTSSNGYQFYNGSTLVGKLVADSTYGIIYNCTTHYFRSTGGTAEYAKINNDGLLLPSNHSIYFTSGSTLTDAGSEFRIDRQTRVDGSFYPKDDNAEICGNSSHRWSSVGTNIVYCPNYYNIDYMEGTGQVMEYNHDNNSSDMHWDSVGNRRMQLNQDGNLSIDGSYSDGGADFAEMFESVDGKEIPKGTSVVLENDKIRPAKKNEEPIGVISSNPTIVGNAGGSNADTEWSGKYLKDDFGNYIMEEAEWWKTEDEDKQVDNKFIKISSKDSGYSDIKKPPKNATKKMVMRKKLNPEYNPEERYISRKDRPEWNIVGLIGRVKILKGQPVSKQWIKLKTISDNLDEYLIK